MPERWLPIPDWPAYEVSDHGRVRSYIKVKPSPGNRRHGFDRVVCDTPQRILKPRMNTRYPYVILKHTGTNWTVHLHTLVLTAFIGPRPDDLVCCHNDGDATNNHLDNLRWDTPSANMQDCIRHGTYRNDGGLAARKFSARQIDQIRKERAQGAVFTKLADKWDTWPMVIFHICVGETYKDCPGPITPRAADYVTATIGE